MKVLYVSCPKVRPNPGGLEIQIENTAHELHNLGVDVVRFDPWRNQISEIDLCHIFSTDGFCLPYAERAREEGKGVIISPVFNCFGEKAWLLALKMILSQWVPGMLSGLKKASAMLHAGDRILALNQQERNLILKSFNIKSERCMVVPNGINPRFVLGDPGLFEEKYGFRDFVLNVGCVEPRKNQLTLIKAMKDLPYTLVIVGDGHSKNTDYMKQCRSAAGDNVIFTGHLAYDDPMLPSAFAGAKLFVLPSYSEVMPLTLYEAALSGCKLIASRNFPIAEEISKAVPRVDPNDPQKLAALIRLEMGVPHDPKLREIVLNMASWADVGQTIKGIYEEVMAAERNAQA